MLVCMREMSFHQPSISTIIDDLLREVWAKHPGVTLIGPGGGTSTQVVAAMQADDFVAVCDSIEEARAVAETIYQYSMKWLFRLNAKKSAIMTCGTK